MKMLLVSIFTFCFIFSAQAKYSQKCYTTYRHMLKESKRPELVKSFQVDSESIVEDHQSLEERSLEIYVDEYVYSNDYLLSVEVFVYKNKESGEVTGFKIVINNEYEDEDVVSFYYSNSGNLFKYYWDNQSPETYWACEGFKQKNAFVLPY